MTERGIRIALAASLFLNVFTIGVVAGGLSLISHDEEGGLVRRTFANTGANQRPGTAPGGPTIPGRPIRNAGDGLPPAERARFQDAVTQALESGRPLARAARLARREAADLFLAPQFDRAAATAALDRARAADMALRARIEAAALDVAASLPPADRAILAAGLERRGPLRGARRPQDARP